MKFKNIPVLLICICAGLLPGSCKRDKPENFDASGAQSSLPAAATQKAATVLRHYYGLKDALVAGRSDRVALAAGRLKTSLLAFLRDSIDNSTVHTEMRTTLLRTTDTLLSRLDSLLSANDTRCEQQRIYFKPISDAMYHFLKEINMKNIRVYRQYCPMALNEEGASWLSRSPDIENPYFGDKMLTCGTLTDTIK